MWQSIEQLSPREIDDLEAAAKERADRVREKDNALGGPFEHEEPEVVCRGAVAERLVR